MAFVSRRFCGLMSFRPLVLGAALLLMSAAVSEPARASDVRHLKKVGNVRCFSISGNSQVVVTGEGKTAVVYDLRSGQSLRQLRHDQEISAVTTSADGKVVGCAAGGNIHIWSDATDKKAVVIGDAHPERIDAVGLYPDGALLISAGKGMIKLWSTTSGQLRQQIDWPGLSPSTAILSADGTLLAAGGIGDSGDSEIRIWRASDLAILHVLRGEKGTVHTLAINREGTRVAASQRSLPGGAPLSGKVLIWNVGEGYVLGSLESDKPWGGVAFSLDGRRLATVQGSTVELYDLNSYEHAVSAATCDPAGNLQYSQDGRYLAYAGEDHDLSVVSSKYLNVAVPLQLPVGVRSIVYEPNLGGFFFAQGNTTPVGFLKFILGKDPANVGIRSYMVAFDPLLYSHVEKNPWTWTISSFLPTYDYFSSGLVMNNSGTSLWHLYRGARTDNSVERLEIKLSRFDPNNPTAAGMSMVDSHMHVTAVTLHPNGDEFIYCLLNNKSLFVGPDLAGHNPKYTLGTLDKDSEAPNLCVSPDQELVAASANSKTIQLYSLKERKLVKTLVSPGKSLAAIGFVAAGKQVLGLDMDYKFHVWDVETGNVIRTFWLKDASGKPRGMRALHFSPDGGYIAAALGGKSIGFFAYDTGDLVDEFITTSDVSCVAFHPLGFDLVAGFDSGRIMRYDLRTVPVLGAAIESWQDYCRHSTSREHQAVAAALTYRDICAAVDRQTKELTRLDAELAGRIKREIVVTPRSEFETEPEYRARVDAAATVKAQLEQQYKTRKDSIRGKAQREIQSLAQQAYEIPSVKIELGIYDPANQQYPISIKADFLGQSVRREAVFRIARDNAKRLKDDWAGCSFSGRARLRTNELLATDGAQQGRRSGPLPRFDLLDVGIADAVSGDRYSLIPDSKGAVFTASSPSAGLPASLTCSVSFEDESGNDMLEAEESGAFWVNVTNAGPGSAFNTNVDITPRTIPHLTYYPVPLGEIPAGASRKVRLPISADLDTPGGENSLTFSCASADGFAAPPVRVTFKTRQAAPPDLVIADCAIDDGSKNGMIEPGELVKVTVRIQNIGQGNARDVTAQVRRGANVFIAEGSQSFFSMERLGPGEYKDIEFGIYANQEARSVPVFVDLKEGTGRYSKLNGQLELAFNVPLRQLTEIYVSGKATEAQQAIQLATGLSSDVDADMPPALARNPDAIGVVFGICDYSNPEVPKAKYAKRDAQFMRQYLINSLGYDPKNIFPRNPDDLMTAGQMKTIMRSIVPRSIRKGVSDVFVYYSGHGAPSTETKEAFFVPYDCDPNAVSSDNAYSVAEFHRDLGLLGARSVVVVVDACFSGSAGNGQSLLTNISPLGLVLNDQRPTLRENTAMLLSSAPDQVSNWYPEKLHGMFTYFFLKGLRGAADGNGDGAITTGEMGAYLTDANNGVPYWSNREFQRPQLPQVSGDKNMIIVRYR